MVALVLVLLITVISFAIPAVQTSAAHKLTSYINNQFGTDIHIDKITLTIAGQVKIKDAYLGDHHNDTLITSASLKTSLINIPGLINGENIDFGNVTAKHLTFRLRRYQEDEKDSFGIFLDKLEGDNPKEEGAHIYFKHLTVIDSKFSFVDEHVRYPDIISLTDLNIDASDFSILGSNISVNINKLTAAGKRGVRIKDLHTKFSLTDNHMNFNDFSLMTNYSQLKSDVHFSFEKTMADFENKVKIDADFKKASISTTDLEKFYNKFGKGQQLNFQGKMKGVLNHFELSDFVLNGIRNTAVNGRVSLQNIFGDGAFRVDGDFKHLNTSYIDLIRLLPGVLRKPLPENLEQLGAIKLQGLVSATSTMVKTNSTVNTEIGNAEIEARLWNLRSPGEQAYKGKLAFNDFNLGEFINNPDMGKASFELHVEGTGVKKENLNTHLEGVFSELTFKGYNYRNIEINGKLENPIFNGAVIIHDPNLKLKAEGLTDISGKKDHYNFNAKVNHADLHALGFNKRDTIALFKGDVSLKMRGHNIDDMVGNINLENVSYKNKKGVYDFKKLNMNSSFDGVVRKITINSPDVINGKIEGYFFLSEVPDLIKNAIGNIYSNYTPVEIEKNQYLDFDFAVHNKIVEAVFPDISLAANTSLMGKVRSSNSNVKLAFKSPEIKAFNNVFENVDLQLDNTNPDHTTYFNVGKISRGSYDFSKVNLVSKRRNDTLYVRSQIKGGEENRDELDLQFYHTINKNNESVIGIRDSHLTFKNATWNFVKNESDQNLIFDNNFENFKVDTLTLKHNDEKIVFNGYKEGSRNKDFSLSFLNVDINKVTPDIKDLALKGIINGRLKVIQEQGMFYPSSNIDIKNFAVNDIDYGDLDIDIAGNKSLTSYAVKVKLGDDEIDYLNVNGRINVARNNPSIDLNMKINKFKLGILDAVGGEVVSDIRGTASGQAYVSGSYKKPSITGKLNLNNAGLKIPYLNIDMALEDHAEVMLLNQEFYFDHVDFEDTKYHTEGQLDGAIAHNNFQEWKIDLNLKAPERLLVLDTEYSDEALYYGTAFISGKANISGPFEELVIDVNARSEKGTVFNIPLNDTKTLANNNYIYFLTPEDKRAKKAGKELFFKELKGLELNFDLDITDEADIEIVVDEKSGSTLQGTGAGTLLMEINTNGKFKMWGDYVVYDGVYNFKYAGLIEKQFQVVSGGNITWDGSPTQAHLDVKALYQTEANPASLLENPTINRSIPVDVYVDLNGMLSDVDIEFELKYPTLSSVVKSELEYRISSRENTELQALSLITQRSFYSEIGPGKSAHPENLLFERAAGLFNDIFSDSEDKFKVGVDYTKGTRTPEQEIADRVGVTLSTNVSDRVLINGKVGVPVGGLARSVVVGDVEVEVLLNEEGTLRAKVFNRESDIQYIGEELGYTQGVGISYSVDFDTFKEMIRKILNKEIKANDIPGKIEKEDKQESLVPDYIKFPGE